NQEVLVQEFVSGVWLSEVLAAVEHQEPAMLATLRQHNIDPKIVAQRLIWMSDWGMHHHLFFHADPHPANGLVQANSTLVFIDFGSAGSFRATDRLSVQQLTYHAGHNDVEGMARAVAVLLEPFPPMDTAAFLRDVEVAYLPVLYAIEGR